MPSQIQHAVEKTTEARGEGGSGGTQMGTGIPAFSTCVDVHMDSVLWLVLRLARLEAELEIYRELIGSDARISSTGGRH